MNPEAALALNPPGLRFDNAHTLRRSVGRILRKVSVKFCLESS
jgi:hypothetical protein